MDYLRSFYFDPFASAEVEAEIKVLLNNKAYGLYSCPVSILKLSSHIISQPLAQILNVSVSSGSFPAKLKTAKVVPVFKSGDEYKPGNYRPISLLPIFNRIFEKLVYKRLIKFVNKHNILYSSQYGFRSRHSTQHATLEILNDILSNFDKGQFTFCLFIDLKKAFDTVNYDILLSKLENYGFRGVVNDWFKSYLIGTRQYKTVNGYISDSHQTLCGVPQGSVLGPLLFLLYIKSDFLYIPRIGAQDGKIEIPPNFVTTKPFGNYFRKYKTQFV